MLAAEQDVENTHQENTVSSAAYATSHDGSPRGGVTGRRFDLLRFFGLLSLLVFFVSGTLSAILISNFLVRNLLERDAVDTQHFLQSVFQAKGSLHAIVTRPSDEHGDLAPELDYIVALPDIMRANLYGMDGRVLWSTSTDLIGRVFYPNDELDQALRGALIFEIQTLAKAEHIGLDAHNQAVENYLPIWDVERRQVLGVIEIYKSPQNLFETITRTRRLVWLGAVIMGLSLYFSLFWIVYRANRLIHHQHEKLIEAETMAAIGEMASAVAHSIRNPVAAIRSSAELALETTAEVTTREMSEDVISEADRLEQWVRELLIFSRPTPGELQSVALDEVLNGCLIGYTRRLERQHIHLQKDMTAAPPVIKGDAGLLAQMFNSIISNALEAMPSGGTLTVRCGLDEPGMLRVIISDTGYGIPPERLKQIFEIRSTSKRGGLGIGLQLVKRIVERHGGTISLTSRPGAGTSVQLQFPVEMDA